MQFQEILKPNYNSVDLSEVELTYNPKHDEPRYNDSNLYLVKILVLLVIIVVIIVLQMRKDMVDQKEGMASLKVKVHLDDMKRVTVREQDYFYYNISNTPFTLGIALPAKYGKYRVRGGLELNQKGRIDGKWSPAWCQERKLSTLSICSEQTVPWREVEAPPWLGVLRVQLRRPGGQEVRHPWEEHETLPGETRWRESQLQLGNIQGETSAKVSGQRNVFRWLSQM